MSDLETALEKYTHALTCGAEFGELQVAFIVLKDAHQKYAYGQYLAEVGCNVD